METFPTSTPALLIRIIKHKLTTQLILHIVHLSANQSHQCFTVDNDLKFILLNFDNLIKFVIICLFDVIHSIGESITTFLGKTYLNTDLL